MPDQLFEAFHVDTQPPPAEAVRRRGDRLRRRRNLAAGGGVAAAVALVAVGAVITGGAFRNHAVAPAKQPRAWVTAVPASLPLASGSNDPSASITVTTPEDLPAGAPITDTITECGRPWQWVLGAAQVAGVAAPGAGIGSPGETRTLAVFPDAHTAHVVEQAIRSTVVACTVAPAPTVLRSSLGDESFAWLDPGASINGIDVVVRVGNAVLLEQTAEPSSSPPPSYPSTEAAAQHAVSWVEPRLQPLIRSDLCVYAVHGCSGKLPVPTLLGPASTASTGASHQSVVPPVTTHRPVGSASSSPSTTGSPSESASSSTTASPSGSPTASSTLPPPPTSSPSTTPTGSATP